jgi:hypothetical protein
VAAEAAWYYVTASLQWSAGIIAVPAPSPLPPQVTCARS